MNLQHGPEPFGRYNYRMWVFFAGQSFHGTKIFLQFIVLQQIFMG